MSINKLTPKSPNPTLGKTKGDNTLARLSDINKVITNINETYTVTNLNFKKDSVGPKVTFVKENYADPVAHKDIIIPGVLELTRGNQQGIYNIAVESSYNNPGPANTLWNSQFIDPTNVNWSFLWNIQNRTYDSWINAITTPNGESAPPIQVGMPMILKETTTNRYWLILFTNWTSGGHGGGFGYERYEIYPTVFFERPDNEPKTVDKISPSVSLARANNRALYNSFFETESVVGESPRNTRWNSIYTDSRPNYSDFTDLSNLESRVYTDFVLALDYNVGVNVLNTSLIMHDLTTDLYYTVVFDAWTQNAAGGGFAYYRTVIPQSEGIKFADGTILNTAAGSGSNSTSFPNTVDPNNNLSLGTLNTLTVSVSFGGTHLIDNFSGML